jgi:hypothetical protein
LIMRGKGPRKVPAIANAVQQVKIRSAWLVAVVEASFAAAVVDRRNPQAVQEASVLVHLVVEDHASEAAFVGEAFDLEGTAEVLGDPDQGQDRNRPSVEEALNHHVQAEALARDHSLEEVEVLGWVVEVLHAHLEVASWNAGV